MAARLLRSFALIGVIAFLAVSSLTAADKPSDDWTFNATIIEACSCPMFCQCYFNAQPAAHGGGGHAGHGGGGEHFCRFNNAFKVNQGSLGSTKLDGAKFWVAGDLGGDFSKGQMDWAVVHFDPAVTPDQREAIKKILTHVYPVTWKGGFTVGRDAPMEWTATKDQAVAKLDNGKLAEVVLKRHPGNTDQPVVIQNLKYWGTPRNEGFVLMPNEVQALRQTPEGKKAYEFKGSNGFLITIDMNSKDVKK